jgi:hypothetical protein
MAWNGSTSLRAEAFNIICLSRKSALR